jgi:hypothetical protein
MSCSTTSAPSVDCPGEAMLSGPLRPLASCTRSANDFTPNAGCATMMKLSPPIIAMCVKSDSASYPRFAVVAGANMWGP